MTIMSDSTYHGPSPNQPLSRNEEIIQDTLDGKVTQIIPLSRIEVLLLKLQALVEAGGGGGGGGIKLLKVNELPAIGDSSTVYLVRSDIEGEEDTYTEYIYLDGSWEKFGHYQDGTGIDYNKLSGKPNGIDKDFIDSLFDD